MPDLFRPRRLAHRGVVDAGAFLVPRGAIGEVRAKEHVVSLAGAADVFRVGEGWIVRLRAPISTTCVHAPGIPLVAVRGRPRVFAAAPLDDDEIARLVPRATADAFVVVRAGVAGIAHPEETVDPSEWLDVDAFAIASVEPLGALPAPPTAALVPVRSVREVLGAAGPNADLVALAKVLRERALAKERGAPPPSSGDVPSALGVAMGGVFAALATFLSLFGGRASAGVGGGGGSSRALMSVPRAAAGPSWIDRARSRILDLVARALVATRLAGMLGRKHAEYLSRMMELFEKGDLEEALRMAIPLGGEGGGDPADPAFLPRTPRSALDIDLLGGARARRSLGLGEDLYDHLKKRYRAAFEKLAAAGRHRDAAFVLVELLGETQEAVSYLERHRLYRLAAELAEGRKLAPGLVIRQWMLAGDRARAVAIARIHGAFADAIARLETSDKDAARQLRLLWADTLASSGAFAAAVDAVWAEPEMRGLALCWLDHAIDAGGVVGARMLARKTSIDPAAFPELRDAVLALLEDASLDGAPQREAFGQELAAGAEPPEVKVLARSTIRALVRDEAKVRATTTHTRTVERLLDVAGDAVLRADLTIAPAVLGPALTPSNEPIVRHLADRGAIVPADAALLSNGRLLVALGEAGARIVSPEGKTLARFFEPAHAIVLSDHGDRALLLAPRGDGLQRIARLDVVGRRVRGWCDARIDVFAPTFDGASWVVASGGTVYVIDVLEDSFCALSELDEPESVVRGVARDVTATAIVRTKRTKPRAAPATALEVWHYDHGLTLRRRRIVGGSNKTLGTFAPPTPKGAIAAVIHPIEAPSEIELDEDGRRALARTIEKEPVWLGAVADDRSFVFGERTDRGLELRFLGQSVELPIVLEGAMKAAARRQEDRLLVHDDCGRILAISMETRRVVQEWRLA